MPTTIEKTSAPTTTSTETPVVPGQLRALRIDFDLPVAILTPDRIDGRALNMSASGLLAATSGAFTWDQEVTLEIQLDDTKLNINARVSRVDDSETAFRFFDLDKTARLTLISFIAAQRAEAEVARQAGVTPLTRPVDHHDGKTIRIEQPLDLSDTNPFGQKVTLPAEESLTAKTHSPEVDETQASSETEPAAVATQTDQLIADTKDSVNPIAGGQQLPGFIEQPTDETAPEEDWFSDDDAPATAEAKVEANSEVQVEVEYEADVEANSEIQVEVEYEADVEANSEVQVEVEYETDIAADVAADAEVDFELEAQPGHWFRAFALLSGAAAASAIAFALFNPGAVPEEIAGPVEELIGMPIADLAGELPWATPNSTIDSVVTPAAAAIPPPPRHVPSAPPKPSNARSAISNHEVAVLVGEGRALFDDGTWSLPVGDSAIDRFRSALELESTNPDAIDGIVDILDGYDRRASEVLANGDSNGARWRYVRMQTILKEFSGEIADSEARQSAIGSAIDNLG